MNRNFPISEVNLVDMFLSCLGLARYVNIAASGKRHVKLRARLCNCRLFGWFSLRLLVFPLFLLPMILNSEDRQAQDYAKLYVYLSISIILVDLSLFVFLRFNIVVFFIFRFLPGCFILVFDFTVVLAVVYAVFKGSVENPSLILAYLGLLALYVVGFMTDILAYKITKPIILHYLAWDMAVFDHKKELLTRYIENQQTLEASYARKPKTTQDKIISDIERDIMKLRTRLYIRKFIVNCIRNTLLRKELESEERACALDMRIRKLCSIFNTELLSEKWTKCWICVVEALECLVLRTKASPQWVRSHILVANIRWYNDLESPWAPTEELFSYYLKHLYFLCPASEMSSVCENLKFHCKYLDDEVKGMITVIEKMFASQQESLDTVKFMVGLSTKELRGRLRQNFIPLICDAGLSLYRECLAEGELELADNWLALRFSEKARSTYLKRLMKATMKALRLSRPSRLQLNGNHEGEVGNYQIPVINFKLSEKRRKIQSWMQQSSIPNKNTTEIINLKLAENSGSVDSCATTKVAPPSDPQNCITELSPEQQTDHYKQQCLAANRNAAELFHRSTRISDDEMNKFPFKLLPLEDLDEKIVLKWTVGGVKHERTTNIQQNVPYHCLSFHYNGVDNEWVVSADWCRVEGLLDVEEEGASRIPLTGDSHPLLQTTNVLQSTTTPFNLKSVFKQHRESREHNIDNYLGEVRSQCVARYYVDRFQEVTNDRFGYLRMLNSTFVLAFDDIERRTIIDMMVRDIHVQSEKFEKFTNNWTYVNKHVNTTVLEAFSHFTHQESQGALMVTDLQGWATQLVDATFTLDNITILLTDPVIHCPSAHTKRFGLVNEGREGINKFYSVIHPECNHICKELRLKRPDGMEQVLRTTNAEIVDEAGTVGDILVHVGAEQVSDEIVEQVVVDIHVDGEEPEHNDTAKDYNANDGYVALDNGTSIVSSNVAIGVHNVVVLTIDIIDDIGNDVHVKIDDDDVRDTETVI